MAQRLALGPVIGRDHHQLLGDVGVGGRWARDFDARRIVQELVNNTLKHAAAKSLLVQLHASEADKLLTLTVEDDGKGFDASVLNQAQGIGWSNIKNRVEFLKGKIDINTATGKGTSVLIELNMA